MGDTLREFYVSVDLYVPKSAVAPRKQLTRRKTEKRDSVRALTAPIETNPKKVKEKSSWLGLPTRGGGGGNEPWRPATCKLVEEQGSCVLSIFIDDSKLYQSVYVHKLNHTDIRHVHRSLVDRRDCLGIYCIAGQTSWSPTPNMEPLYLHFPYTDLMNIWMALLRSYAVPEIYGRYHSVSDGDGGLYRMWRQVKLTCMQGRNLGISRPFTEETINVDSEPKTDGDAIDLDVYCEIYVNGILSGRTTVKKGVGSPDWSESFIFMDLSPFENLEIVVYREKKLVKPVVVGSILIYLVNFRRGEHVEGWFPVVNSSGSHVGVQLGELRLKMRVDEEIILPFQSYTTMLRTLRTRNYLDWIADLEVKLKLKDTLEHIMSVAQADGVLLGNIKELANREVDGTQRGHNTLFRGNSIFTKAMEVFMVWYGSAFLEVSLGAVIRRLCTEKVAIEIDPARLVGRHAKTLERNVDLLVYWCNEFWSSIYDARKQCPSELRNLFAHIRTLVEKRYVPTEEQSKEFKEFKELPWQSISSFLFLRFMVPAILHPHLFGLWPGLNSGSVQRSLTLIGKVLQGLANLNISVQKEDFMHAVKDFLSKSSTTMLDYIMVVSSPESDQAYSTPGPRDGRGADRDRIRLLNALAERTDASLRLHSEAIPTLPYLLDVPKQLALVSSLVVRYSRRHNHSAHPIDPEEVNFKEFCTRCLEVEEQALQSVSRLARKPKLAGTQPVVQTRIAYSPVSPSASLVPTSPTSTHPIPSSPNSPTSTSPRERKTSHQSKRRRPRKAARPSTAPGDSEVESRSHSTDISVPSSPTATHSITRMFSRSSLSSSRHSTQIPSSTEEFSFEGEPRSLPVTRPPLVHHPRSTSTDSALLRKPNYVGSPTSSVSHVVIEANHPDGMDEAGKKRRGLLRGILVRR